MSEDDAIRSIFLDIQRDWRCLEVHAECVFTAAKEQLETERIKSAKKGHVALLAQNLESACNELELIVSCPISLPVFDSTRNVSDYCADAFKQVKHAEHNLELVRNNHEHSIEAKKELEGI